MTKIKNKKIMRNSMRNQSIKSSKRNSKTNFNFWIKSLFRKPKMHRIALLRILLIRRPRLLDLTQRFIIHKTIPQSSMKMSLMMSYFHFLCLWRFPFFKMKTLWRLITNLEKLITSLSMRKTSFSQSIKNSVRPRNLFIYKSLI